GLERAVVRLVRVAVRPRRACGRAERMPRLRPRESLGFALRGQRELEDDREGVLVARRLPGSEGGAVDVREAEREACLPSAVLREIAEVDAARDREQPEWSSLELDVSGGVARQRRQPWDGRRRLRLHVDPVREEVLEEALQVGGGVLRS